MKRKHSSKEINRSKFDAVKKLHIAGTSVSETAKILGIGVSTVHRYRQFDTYQEACEHQKKYNIKYSNKNIKNNQTLFTSNVEPTQQKANLVPTEIDNMKELSNEIKQLRGAIYALVNIVKNQEETKSKSKVWWN